MSQLGELGFSSTSSGRATKPKRGRGCLAVLLSLVVLAGIGWFAWDRGQSALTEFMTVPDYSGDGQGEVDIQVGDGDSIREIAATLESNNVVKSTDAFEEAAGSDSRALSIQPGHYTLREEMSGEAALELILDPEARVLERVTVPEGRRLGSTLKVLSEESGIDREDFDQVLEQDDGLNLPEYAEDDVEGFLYPATYDVDPSTTAQSLLQQMVDRFDKEAEDLKLANKSDELGYTPREIVTVASLIEAEARQPDDFPKVARVVYNRLDQGMLLELDSTTNYAVESDTVTTTPEDRNVRDPYNTYWARGLPPGPINAPGTRALEAALRPADGDWLFFVTVDLDTGETKFSETIDEHNKNKREFQEWCQDNKGTC